ncbi:hypothetical protein [Paracoccus marinaquae]|uniref:DUF1127 domain-containing protein n=1 Tax=Paracoccus marinaquae TaxID=2841926 RepID=A0ABS6AIY2_9RHOB|nr:hypothetical protein [Paracoccus marinaquae]MBU3029857.1 hypothetical protein [Paracoccus marinaquae]
MIVIPANPDKPRLRLGAALAAPFVAIGKFLVSMAEAGPQMRAIERLNRISDADLAARGLTRDGEIRRILRVGA